MTQGSAVPVIAWGFITKDGLIDPQCVAGTRIGAMVNAIVIVTDNKVMPLQAWTERDIENAFEKHKNGGRIAPLRIQEATR